MGKNVFGRSPISVIQAYLFPMFFTVAIIGMIVYGLDQTERSSRDEGLRILDDSIRRAAVTCYAVEGSYPEDLSYIEENYGVYIDRAKYVVHYDIFASNILPDITVVELSK